LVTQQALRHTSIETTLYYLDTLKDDVSAAMPNFDFSPEVAQAPQTKIVTLKGKKVVSFES